MKHQERVFDNNAEQTTDTDSESFPHYPLSLSGSVSSFSTKDAPSINTTDIDQLTKSLFTGAWLNDEISFEEDNYSVESHGYSNVMKLIDHTIEDTAPMEASYHSCTSPMKTMKLPSTPLTEQTQASYVDIEKGRSEYRRIPRRRQRVKCPNAALRELIIDRVRAAIIFSGVLLVTVKICPQSMQEKSFGIKVVGVLTLCSLASISLDDPRGDKTSVASILFSRKAALLIIYIWAWTSALDWVAALYSKIEQADVFSATSSANTPEVAREIFNVHEELPHEQGTLEFTKMAEFDFQKFIIGDAERSDSFLTNSLVEEENGMNTDMHIAPDTIVSAVQHFPLHNQMEMTNAEATSLADKITPTANLLRGTTIRRNERPLISVIMSSTVSRVRQPQLRRKPILPKSESIDIVDQAPSHDVENEQTMTNTINEEATQFGDLGKESFIPSVENVLTFGPEERLALLETSLLMNGPAVRRLRGVMTACRALISFLLGFNSNENHAEMVDLLGEQWYSRDW